MSPRAVPCHRQAIALLEIHCQARYDIAVNTPPIGYQESSPTKLMFTQMWEKRGSGGFEIPCPSSGRILVSPFAVLLN